MVAPWIKIFVCSKSCDQYYKLFGAFHLAMRTLNLLPIYWTITIWSFSVNSEWPMEFDFFEKFLEQTIVYTKSSVCYFPEDIGLSLVFFLIFTKQVLIKFLVHFRIHPLMKWAIRFDSRLSSTHCEYYTMPFGTIQTMLSQTICFC